jgi:DHA2 family multidrug resistance protein
VQSRLGEGVRPDNPMLGMHAPGFDFGAPDAVAGMHHEIVRQAMMVAYIDAFWLLFLLSVALLPLILLFRPARAAVRPAAQPVME